MNYSAIRMADLPTEMWHSIFERLEDLADLYSCSLVCKAVYVAFKSYRIREVAFTRGSLEWFHYTTSFTNHQHRVYFENFFLLSSFPLKRSSFNFDYLKRLKIGRLTAIDLNVINRFVHLEELDIDLANYRKEKRSTLSLANLKVLYVYVPNYHQHLELDTPRLEKVCTFSLKLLEFIYSESVRCIHTVDLAGKLSTFRNLECLNFTNSYNEPYEYICSSPPSLEEFSVETMKAMKKLKEIHFSYDLWYGKENLSILKRMTANFLALERPDLKVFWLNVQVTDAQLSEYEAMYANAECVLAFQFQNYDKLNGKVHFRWSFEFTWTMRKLQEPGLNPSERFLSKFLAKFFLRRIAIHGKVEEPDILLELIARSPCLFSLVFLDSGLDQSFFNRMVETVRLNRIPLQKLQLKKRQRGVDLEFVLGLRDLEWFETTQQLSPEFVLRLFSLPMLDAIEFFSGNIVKRVRRVSRSRYSFLGERLRLPELLERLNRKSSVHECSAY